MKTGWKLAAVVAAWVVGTAIGLFEMALMIAVIRREGFLLGAVAWVNSSYRYFYI